MQTEFESYYQEFFQEVYADADIDGAFVEDAFFDLFCGQLIDAGEIETADRAQYLGPRGMRIDGYGGDPIDTNGILTLIVADFLQSDAIGTLTMTELNKIFPSATNFLKKALDKDFRDGLEESSPAFGLATLIAGRWTSINVIRIVAISNRVLSTRAEGRAAIELKGIPLTFSVWDFGRLHRYVMSGRGREEIEIDIERDYGSAWQALPAHLDNAEYEAFLVVMSGRQLADIYGRWGSQLLEQNVRSFLQARANVNKGIRTTLENTPEMFFAYNNGITATAEHVETRLSERGLQITHLTNLQIVNGGQTTASIFAASRKSEVDLSRVFVQMKLSVIDPAKAEEIVPKISEFANSQNRVNAADFFANHPFHVRMEQFSRRIFAPSPDGTFRESKWFYERARGQYLDGKSRLTPAQTKKYEIEYPKSQLLSKTDLAKFLNCWKEKPDLVSKGAQKNFASFAEETGKEWTKGADDFNESFYRDSVAKAIIFREIEKLVTSQPWYGGGYRANVVAYAIAKIARDIRLRQDVVNFEDIWKKQGLTPGLRDALIVAAKAAHEVLVSPSSAGMNVTEWAKQQGCWNRLAYVEIAWPEGFVKELKSRDVQVARKRDAIKDQKLLNGIESQAAVFNAGAELGRSVLDWGNERRLLSVTELGCLRVAATMPAKIPTERQSSKILDALRRMQQEGCMITIEI